MSWPLSRSIIARIGLPAISHGFWSLANILVQGAAFLALQEVGFAIVSLLTLAGSQLGQLARSSALEPGLGEDGTVTRVHVRAAVAVFVSAAAGLSWAIQALFDATYLSLLFYFLILLSVGSYDLFRNRLLLSGQYRQAALCDGVWAITTALLLAILIVAELEEPLYYSGAWSISALAALLVGLIGRPSIRSSSAGHWNWSAPITFAWDYLSVAGAAQAFVLLSASTSAVQVIATLRLAQLLLAPVNFLVTGIRSFLYQSLEVNDKLDRLIRQGMWVSGVVVVAVLLVGLNTSSMTLGAVVILFAQRLLVLTGLFVSVKDRKSKYYGCLLYTSPSPRD